MRKGAIPAGRLPTMFSEMVAQLNKGQLPVEKELRARLEAAVVKKMGVLKTPYLCWSSDTKINPLTKHMLWAAILLGDREKVGLITGIIAAEKDAATPGGRPFEISTSTGVNIWVDELRALAGENIREMIRAQVEKSLAQGK